jgi:poly-gamma-glutamate capsule biosynthesis protein CapA/YwtB (metallophosphatase superfamily)
LAGVARFLAAAAAKAACSFGRATETAPAYLHRQIEDKNMALHRQTSTWLGLTATALLAPLSVASAQSTTPQLQSCPSDMIPDVENAKCSDNDLDALWDYAWNAYNPVKVNHAQIAPLPRKKVFVPPSQRGGLTQKRIVLFGDLFGKDKDMAPYVTDEVRAVFSRADLVLGNIEAPVTDNNGKLDPNSVQFLNFHANVAYLKSVMAQYCIDPAKTVFTVANNHADDLDRWDDTVEYSPDLDATIVGIDHNKQSRVPEITVKDVGNLRVGVVGWTHLQNRAPKCDANNEIAYPTWEASRRVTEQSDWEDRKDALGIDLLIGMPHWDCQFNWFPHQETVTTANALHAKGFDLIAGSHQGLQPGALYTGPGHEAENELTFYGLGALLVTTPMTENELLNVVEVVVDGNGRTLEYELHPFLLHKANPNVTWVRSVGLCGSRIALDWPRQTEEKIVSFDWLRQNGSDKDRAEIAKFETYLDTVFPR